MEVNGLKIEVPKIYPVICRANMWYCMPLTADTYPCPNCEALYCSPGCRDWDTETHLNKKSCFGRAWQNRRDNRLKSLSNLQ
jgi:hypothetical protein